MAYAWLTIVRAIASVFAIIELGLTAYGTLPLHFSNDPLHT